MDLKKIRYTSSTLNSAKSELHQRVVWWFRGGGGGGGGGELHQRVVWWFRGGGGGGVSLAYAHFLSLTIPWLVRIVLDSVLTLIFTLYFLSGQTCISDLTYPTEDILFYFFFRKQIKLGLTIRVICQALFPPKKFHWISRLTRESSDAHVVGALRVIFKAIICMHSWINLASSNIN